MTEDSFKERYLNLRDEHTALNQKLHEKEDTIRKLHVKLAQLERNAKPKQSIDPVDNSPDVAVIQKFSNPRNREQEQLIDELYKRNADLQKENSDLKLLNKNQSELLKNEKKKTERERKAKLRAVNLSSKKYTPRSQKPQPTVNPGHVHIGRPNRQETKLENQENLSLALHLNQSKYIDANDLIDMHNVAEKLRDRLLHAEEQLICLSEENEVLRSEALNDVKPLSRSIEMSRACDVDEMMRLRRELKDLTARYQLLVARYENLEARDRAQGDLHNGSVDRLEEGNRQIRDLTRALNDMSLDKEAAQIKASRVGDLEEMCQELKHQNRALEDQITRLCENPFIEKALVGVENAERLEELEKAEISWQKRAQHLQETAQEHHTALLVLQKEVVTLREDKESAECQLRELINSRQQAEAGAHALAKKMKVYSEEEGIDMEELERALAVVRRRMDTIHSNPDFLNLVDEPMDTVPALKRKLQQLQVSNLGLIRELERSERMLQAQMGINKDLHIELEERASQIDMNRQQMADKLADMEQLSLKRLRKIQDLEAQLRQLRYMSHVPEIEDSSAGDNDDALMSELLEEDIDLNKNVIEVWVVGVKLRNGVIPTGSSSFVMVDFYNFESQATTLLIGNEPHFDFATTFKVTVDDLFFRYISSGGIVLELNQSKASDYKLVAKCNISLMPLLSSRPKMIFKNEPLISVNDGSIVGHIHVEVRMALPVSELYTLFLERNPNEKAHISKFGNGCELNFEDKSRDIAFLQNELEIGIISCKDLPKRESTGELPSVYVHYQLLGFQDVFTPIANSGCCPDFNHACAFPVVTDSRLIRFLCGYELVFTVLDDTANQKDEIDENGGLIGEARVSLASIASGEDFMGLHEIVNSSGDKCGTIDIAIKWRKPLKKGGQVLGINALTGVEVDYLIRRFSPQKDGQVCWTAFLRYADMPLAVNSALRKIQNYIKGKQKLCDANNHAAILGLSIDQFPNGFTEEEFIRLMMQIDLDVPPDELTATYKFLDVTSANSVTIDTMNLVFKPSGRIEENLKDRLYNRLQQVKLRGTSLFSPFQKFDSEHRERVTRYEFKQCLKELGFVLVDDFSEKGFLKDDFFYGVPCTNDKEGNAKQNSNELKWEKSLREAAVQQKSFQEQVADIERAVAARVSEAAAELIGDHNPLDFAPNSPLRNSTFPQENRCKSHSGPDCLSLNSPSKSPMRPAQASVNSPRNFPLESGQGPMFSHQNSTNIFNIGSLRKPEVEFFDTNIQISQENGGNTKKDTILDAEDAIRNSIPRMSDFDSFLANMTKAFKTLDSNCSGHLNRSQFAFAIRKIPEISIPPLILRAAMDFFDKSISCQADKAQVQAEIDYNAFIDFCSGIRDFNILPSVAKLRQFILGENAWDIFAQYDILGSGCISRDDMISAFRRAGYLDLPKSMLYTIAVLFESDKDRVNYTSLVQYVQEQTATIEFFKLKSDFKRHVQNLIESKGSIRDVFQMAVNVTNGYTIEKNNFLKSLFALSFPIRPDNLQNLFKAIAQKGTEIDFKSFSAFVSLPQKNTHHKSLNRILSTVDVDGLKIRAKATLAGYLRRDHEYLSKIYNLFSRYDFQQTDRISLEAFYRAIQAAGFPFTLSEGMAIGYKFGHESSVDFNHFLKWITPEQHEITDFYSQIEGWSKADENLENAHGHFALFGQKNDEVEPERIHVRGALRSIAKKLYSRKQHALKEIFMSFSNGRPTLTGQNLAIGLERNGLHMAAKEAQRFVQQVGNGKDMLQLNEFLNEMRDGVQSTKSSNEIVHLGNLKSVIKRAIAMGIDYRAQFEASDSDFEGSITISQFSNTLRELGGIGEDAIDFLIRKFVDSTDEKVCYIDCLRWGRDRIELTADTQAEVIGEKFRQAVRINFDWINVDQLKRAFCLFDYKNNGSIEEKGLKEGSKRLGLEFDFEERKELLKLMDVEDAGKVSFCTFVTFVRDPNNSDIIEKVVEGLSNLTLSRREKLKQLIYRRDPDGDGIATHSLGQIFEKFGVYLVKDELKRFSYRFDSDGGGLIGTKNLLQFIQEGNTKKISCTVDVKTLPILKNILKKSNRHGGVLSLKADFEEFDHENSKLLSHSSFRSVLQENGIYLPRSDLFMLYNNFSGKDNFRGLIRYLDVIEALQSIEINTADSKKKITNQFEISSDSDCSESLSKSASSGSIEGFSPKRRVLMRLKHNQPMKKDLGIKTGFREKKFQKKSKFEIDDMMSFKNILSHSTEYRKIVEAFKEADINGNGVLSWKKIQSVLVSMDIHLSKNLLENIKSDFEIDQSGRILYMKFLRGIRSYQHNPVHVDKSDYSEEDSLYEIGELARLMEHENLAVDDLLAELEGCDVNGVGEVEVNEFRGALGRLGIKINLKVASSMQKSFAGQRKGHMLYDDLCNELEAVRTNRQQIT